MRYTLRQLQVFLAAAHSENITRAAEVLSMSQSAASSALRDLESQFDIQLFDRVGKRLQLNALGRLLRPKVESLLEQAQLLELDFKQHKDQGSLRVGATLTIGDYLSADIIARYVEDTGGEIEMVVANTQAITRMVENFELDIGLIEGEVHHADLEIIPWLEDRLQVFCEAGQVDAFPGVLDDSTLSQVRWVVRESGSGTRQAFDRAMQGILNQLNISYELQQTEAIKRAVRAGLGVGCLSEFALKDEFERGVLAPLSIVNRDLSRRFYIIVHKHKYRGPGIDRLLQLCKAMETE